jgi:GTP-binding protein
VPVGTIIWAKKPADSVSENTQEFVPRELVTKKTVTKTVIRRLKIKYTDEWEQLVDLNEPGMKVLIAMGGAGGRGNTAFKSSINTTPMYAEAGHWGVEKFLRLELKILADVGLVGLPNAGKSTLLSILTSARPEIADYPFTTINPNLGVLEGQQSNGEKRSVVIADIPGLIEDAHKGRGLGVEFLRHIERCRTLVYVISPTGEDLGEISKPKFQISNQLLNQFNMVRKEVQSYGHEVDKKPRLVVINKIDVMTDDMVKKTLNAFTKLGEKVTAVSAATMSNISELRKTILEQ